MDTSVPIIINTETNLTDAFPYIDSKEAAYLKQSAELFNAGFYSHSLLDIWNAAVNNLKRKVEAYSVDLWIEVVKDEPGRKKYNKNGDTIALRWEEVDDLVLIAGATKLGLLNPKAGKSLEMINWMRNHASPAHDSDSRVEKEDVIGLVLLLQKNLFTSPIPDATHAVKEIFAPVKEKEMDKQELSVLQDQIKSSNVKDTRTIFGFLLNMVINGEEPAYSNAKYLFPTVWEKADTELRKDLGVRYNSYSLNASSDKGIDNKAKNRVFELIVLVKGVSYIPDGARAIIYRRAAEKMRIAKNTSYGWSAEVSACKMLAQLGTSIPSVVFEEVYQEIIAIWCGNMWGHSESSMYIRKFFDCLDSSQIRKIATMFCSNERVKEELCWNKPKTRAIELLNELKSKLTIESHKEEIENTIMHL